MRRTLLAGAVLGFAAALGLGAPATAQPAAPHHHPAPASVSVLHAVPKVPVDVYLGSKRILNDFQPGTLAGPMKVKAGTYTVRITAAAATSWKHPLIGPEKVRFRSGRSYTLVAHLTAKGSPTLTEYGNDTRAVKRGQGRITVRHDAAAPAVDVRVNGAVAMRHLTNPHQSKAVLKAGAYSLAVDLAGTTTTVIGPVPLPLKAGANTIVYAWGSAKDGTLAAAVQVVPLHHR